MNVSIRYIADRWNQTIRLVRPRSLLASTDIFSDILRRYDEPHRAYHNLTHLQQGFKFIDEIMAKLPGMESVELAFWFHDIIYVPQNEDNEEQSAAYAERAVTSLGFDQAFAQQVGNLVLATKHKHPPHTREAQVLLDVDLSIFASEPAEFDAYDAAIRQEYSWVLDAVYKPRRAKFLHTMLGRERIYSTPEFRSGYEGRARDNLRRAIAALET